MYDCIVIKDLQLQTKGVVMQAIAFYRSNFGKRERLNQQANLDSLN